METLLAILHGLSMLKFAILAIPERQWYIVAFVTPIILIGGAVLKEIRAYNRLKNENS